MILTKREIFRCLPPKEDAIAFARAIESAVLKKLKAQEPFAFHHDEEGLSYSNHYTGTVPLYSHPLPPDDVVRDAERLDWIQANCRCDPMMDGQHKWWPTNFNKCLTGPSIREAIDAAMKGGAA